MIQPNLNYDFIETIYININLKVLFISKHLWDIKIIPRDRFLYKVTFIN